ncbi:MAG: quinol:electron acceptor oxidoreductase subunit ActD [Candidatus Kapaibacteriota bacterium]
MALVISNKQEVFNYLRNHESGKQYLLFSTSPLNKRNLRKKFSFYLFCFGIICFIFSLAFQYWVNALVYPQSLSGKPYFSLLTAIPFSFEFTLALVGIVLFLRFLLVCYSRNESLPSEVKQNLHKLNEDCVMIYFYTNPNNSPNNSTVDQNA